MPDTWLVDDMIVHRLADYQAGERPLGFFFPDADPAALAAQMDWFAPEGLDPANGHLLMSFHSYLLRTPTRTVLIDSCIGCGKDLPMAPSWHGARHDRWLDELRATGTSPDDVDIVICTHLHADHVGWNTTLVDDRWAPTFPNARYLFVAEEFAWTRDWVADHGDDDSPVARSRRSAWAQSIRPVVAAGLVDLVAPDHAIDDHLRLLPTPGHTPGHVAVCAGRGGDRVVFTGDLIYSPLQTRLPDLPMTVDADRERAIATRRAFLERFADTGTLVCTMHFPAPSAGLLRRWRDGYRLDYGPPARA